MALAYQPRCFSVDEYYAMAAAGVLAPEERVELLDGEVITMAPIGASHGGIVDRIAHALFSRFSSRANVRIQGPVRLSDYSEVHPDIALLRARSNFYSDAHPGPEDVLALIEVAQTSLGYDSIVKRAAYARAGITEYWIADVAGKALTILRDPRDGEYHFQSRAQGSEAVAFLAFPEDRFEASTFP